MVRGWLLLLLLVGGFLIGTGTASLVGRRPVGPRFLRIWHRATWMVWSEVLLGFGCVLLAASMWPYSAVTAPAAVIAAFGVLIALVGSIVAFVSGSRSAETNGPS